MANCLCDERGRPNFRALHAAMPQRRPDISPMAYFVIRSTMSISVRRPYRNVSAIWSGFATTPRKAVPCLFLVESFPKGEPLLEWCEHYQLEGIVSKRLTSRYSSGTCREWQ